MESSRKRRKQNALAFFDTLSSGSRIILHILAAPARNQTKTEMQYIEVAFLRAVRCVEKMHRAHPYCIYT